MQHISGRQIETGGDAGAAGGFLVVGRWNKLGTGLAELQAGGRVDGVIHAGVPGPKAAKQLIVGGIEVGDDGKYGFKKEDGTVGTIEDAATTWLKGKPWAVKDNQNGGSGQGSSGQNAGNDVKAQFEAALGIPQATKGD